MYTVLSYYLDGGSMPPDCNFFYEGDDMDLLIQHILESKEDMKQVKVWKLEESYVVQIYPVEDDKNEDDIS